MGRSCQFHWLLALPPQGVEHHHQTFKNDLYPHCNIQMGAIVWRVSWLTTLFITFLVNPLTKSSSVPWFSQRITQPSSISTSDFLTNRWDTATCSFVFDVDFVVIWIQGSDASQTFSYLVPIFCVRSDTWWLLFFMTRHLPLSTAIGYVGDIFNDPAAGVRTVCPSLHGFRLQGYAYDFVWAMSVTHEGFLYPDVRLQEKPSDEHDNRDPPPTFRLLYAWGEDIFNSFCY